MALSLDRPKIAPSKHNLAHLLPHTYQRHPIKALQLRPSFVLMDCESWLAARQELVKFWVFFLQF